MATEGVTTPPRVEVGNLCFLSSYSRGIGPPLELQQKLSFLSSCCWKLGVSSRVVPGDSELLSITAGNQCSSGVPVRDADFTVVMVENLEFFSSFVSTQRIPLDS